jgi:NAD-dependent SIR2 family protein deacetylase
LIFSCSDEECKGLLKDTIIHFGESLPVKEYSNAEKESKKCDIALVIGTSMRVQPACILPSLNCGKNKKGDLVIVNLQITPCKISFLNLQQMIRIVRQEFMLKRMNL